jgi:hypothetical protein
MTLSCPQCGRPADLSALGPGQFVECPQCHMRVGLPSATVPATRAPLPIAQRPVFVPVPVNRNPFDFANQEIDDEEHEERRSERKEKRQERREVRDERREERRIRGLERSGNMLGVTALALSCATAVLVTSGLIFARKLTLYAGFIGVLAVPGTISGLVTGLISALRPGRSRLFGTVAACVSGLLLLVGVPLLWLLLTESDPASPPRGRGW